MRVSAVLLSGIRDFKWAGPKPSQTRKANTRKRFKLIAANHNVMKQYEQRLQAASLAKGSVKGGVGAKV